MNRPFQGLARLHDVADVLEASTSETFAVLSAAEAVGWVTTAGVGSAAGRLGVEKVLATIRGAVRATHEQLARGCTILSSELGSEGACGYLRGAQGGRSEEGSASKSFAVHHDGWPWSEAAQLRIKELGGRRRPLRGSLKVLGKGT